MEENIVPEPENYDEKEVYAFFGLASYYAQVVEKGIMCLLSFACFMKIHGKSDLKEKYEEAFDWSNKFTYGQMLKTLESYVSLNNNEKAILENVRNKRNYLIHHYWLDNIIKMKSETGRKKIIDEMIELIEYFKKADNLAGEILQPLMAKYNITDETLMTAYKKLVDDYLNNE